MSLPRPPQIVEFYQQLDSLDYQSVKTCFVQALSQKPEWFAPTLELVYELLRFDFWGTTRAWYDLYEAAPRDFSQAELLAHFRLSLPRLSFDFQTPRDWGIALSSFEHWTAFADTWREERKYSGVWRGSFADLWRSVLKSVKGFQQNRDKGAGSLKMFFEPPCPTQSLEWCASPAGVYPAHIFQQMPVYWDCINAHLEKHNTYERLNFTQLIRPTQPDWQQQVWGQYAVGISESDNPRSEYSDYYNHLIDTRIGYNKLIEDLKTRPLILGFEFAIPQMVNIRLKNGLPAYKRGVHQMETLQIFVWELPMQSETVFEGL